MARRSDRAQTLGMLIRFIGTLLACCATVACGGATSSDSTNTAGVGGIGSNSGGASSNVGGASSTGGGGASGTSTCAAVPVSFEVVPAPNTSWCLGQPEGCGGGGFSIIGPSGELQLSNLCQYQCETCTVGICPPVVCLGPSPLQASGLSYTWDGQYFASGNTCGASALSCWTSVCATAGQYALRICGFTNPDPSNADSCIAAQSSASYACTDFDFDYPFTGVKTFVLSN